jgi:hypothetical protein
MVRLYLIYTTCQADSLQSQRCNNLSHMPQSGFLAGQHEQHSSTNRFKFTGNVARAWASMSSDSVNNRSKQWPSTVILV